jgi:CubicO group peptidase (beta-lactamase class C family)
MKVLCRAALPALMGLCLATPTSAQTIANDLATTLDEHVPAWLEETGDPGLAVVVIEDCRPALIRAWGIANRKSGRPMSQGTVFNLGSISKTLTAWGVMRLAESGAIELDAPVGRYLERWALPTSEFDAEAVTVRRLLSHTAGLNVPSVAGVDPDTAPPSLLDELEKGRPAEGMEPVRIVQPPGTAFDYSGGGYLVLQLLVEDVTGQPFAEWMAGQVLQPLGMASSAYGLDPSLIGRAATPYATDGAQYAHRVYPGLAAAGLWSTAEDVGMFLAAHCTDREGKLAGEGVVSPDGLASMWIAQPPAERYGLGYEVYPPLGEEPVVGHSGSNFGWKADFLLFPRLGLGIAALTNVDEGETRMAVMKAFRDAVVAAARAGTMITAPQ